MKVIISLKALFISFWSIIRITKQAKARQLILIFLLSLVGCQKENGIQQNTLGNDNRSLDIVLFQYSVIGEKQPNPLEMSNILNAFNQLSPETKGSFTVDDIKPTHKYVAFTPTKADEYYALQDIDENEIMLSVYPLDYEVSDVLYYERLDGQCLADRNLGVRGLIFFMDRSNLCVSSASEEQQKVNSDLLV